MSKLVPDNARAVTVGNAVLGYYVGEKSPSKTERIGRRSIVANVRLTEVEKVIKAAFGGPVVTDDAEWLAPVVADVAAQKFAMDAARKGDDARTPRITRKIATYLKRWFPNLSAAERGRFGFQAASARDEHTPDKLAEELGVTYALRQELGLRTIGASDVTARTRKMRARKMKRERDRLRAIARRRAAGAMPRETYQEQSDAELARRAGVHRNSIRNWRRNGILEQKLSERGIDCASPSPATEYIYARDAHAQKSMKKGGKGALNAPKPAPTNRGDDPRQDRCNAVVNGSDHSTKAANVNGGGGASKRAPVASRLRHAPTARRTRHA